VATGTLVRRHGKGRGEQIPNVASARTTMTTTKNGLANSDLSHSSILTVVPLRASQSRRDA